MKTIDQKQMHEKLVKMVFKAPIRKLVDFQISFNSNYQNIEKHLWHFLTNLDLV